MNWNMNTIISIHVSQWLSYKRGARRVYQTLTWRWWLYTIQMLFPPTPNLLFYQDFFFNQDFKMHLHPCRHDWKSWNHRINPLMNRIKFPQAFHSFHPRAIWCFKLRNELSHTCFHAEYQSLRISLITVLVWSLLAIHYSENEYFRDTWGDVSCSQLCVKFP